MPATASLSNLIGRFVNALEEVPGSRRKALPASRAPSDDERMVLVARQEALRVTLEPADPAYIKRSISALKAGGGFPVTNASADNAKITIRLYEEGLKDMPEWAIAEACRLVIANKAGLNPSFFPTVPEMVTICRRLVTPWIMEQERIRIVLQAEIYREPTDEERARIAQCIRELAQSLRPPAPEVAREEPPAMPSPPKGQSLVDSSRRFIDRELRAAGIDDGLPMSLGLRAKLAEMKENPHGGQ